MKIKKNVFCCSNSNILGSCTGKYEKEEEKEYWSCVKVSECRDNENSEYQTDKRWSCQPNLNKVFDMLKGVGMLVG